MNCEDIFKTYAVELRKTEERLAGIFKSNVFLLPMIGRHIAGSGGKRLRPLFLLLSAGLCGYKGDKKNLLAAIIEAIHTASLLHDDVIDGADTRRGKPAANALWGNQVVILVGDFLYSNALKLAVLQKNQRIMEALSEATTKMTEGEILQLSKIGDPDITTDEYYEIISAKTGVLISAACRIGAILGGAGPKRENALAAYGMKIGIAFQLADDILDYVAQQKNLGKRLGKDLEEGKITMPMIRLLKNASKSEVQEIKDIIKEQKKGGKKLQRIIELFEKYNAIGESLCIAQELVDEAKKELAVFPVSKQKSDLLLMADYAMQRQH
ncbi:MAG: polyprenyl synthetase family protein [Nitrospirae bacterium]|nr:MAG: polyprenyl synthetase family protein [Nitrospirota bacterium]